MVLGNNGQEERCHFAYRAITVFGEAFQTSSTMTLFCHFPALSQESPLLSHDPRNATPGSLARCRFRLFPVRSPLLGESLVLSLPRGTEMFQFPRFASSCEDTGGLLQWVAPFGNPRIDTCLQLPGAYRS